MVQTEEIPEGMRRCRAKNPNCENQFEDYPLGILPATLEYFYAYKNAKDGLVASCKVCRTIPREQDPEGMRRCTGECGRVLPATSEFFHHRGYHLLADGKRRQLLQPVCKTCRNRPKPPTPPEGSKECSNPNCENPKASRIKFQGKLWRVLPATTEFFPPCGVTVQGLPALRGDCRICFNAKQRKKHTKKPVPPKPPKGMKRCSKPDCENPKATTIKVKGTEMRVLPATTEFFNVGSKRPDGLYPQCKFCKATDRRKPEAFAKQQARHAIWRKEFPEKFRASWKSFQKTDKFKDYQKTYAEEHPEQVRGWRKKSKKKRRTRKRKERNEALNAFYRENDIPDFVWHEGEFADEPDFQKAIEWMIVNRKGYPIEHEVWLAELGRCDIYVPWKDLIIEVKLLSTMWTRPHKREHIRDQTRRYRKISPTVIVSLDGSPDWWADEEEFADVPWLSPDQLLRSVSFQPLIRDPKGETKFRIYSNGRKIDQRTYKDGKLITAVAWRIDGEKCPVTKVIDGNGTLMRYNTDGTEFGLFTYKDGELVKA